MLARYSVRQNPEHEKTKNVDQAKWNDLISRQAAEKSTPPSAEGPQGLGDWRWLPHFRTITWQVPGSMGFVGSKRETKHYLWNCNLIDCCSHYSVEFLKLLRAWARKSQREIERKRLGDAERKRYGAQRCKALEVLCISATPQRLAGRQAGSWKREKNPKDPHLKNHSLWCFPLVQAILNFSQNFNFTWPWNWIVVANAFSTVIKRSDFSSQEKV